MKPPMKLHLIRMIDFQFDLISDCSKLGIKRLFVPRRRGKKKRTKTSGEKLKTTLKEVDSDGL